MNPQKIETEIVSTDEMNRDIQSNESSTVLEMSPDAIPDIKKLTADIFELLIYIDSPDMQKLKRDCYGMYLNKIDEKYQDMPYSIIKLLSDESDNRDDNIIKLLNILETMNSIKEKNKNLDSEYEKFRENLNEEYVYPEFGGKDKFEEKMKNKSIS